MTAGIGPLAGIRVVEFASLGPAPQGSMVLADLGADVVRIDRPNAGGLRGLEGRGKRSICLDLKVAADLEIAIAMCDQADVVVEGFRPGVMERLGLGPDYVTERNPRVVYARMTGWGQSGPYAKDPGHDINFVALTGVLAASGKADRPPQSAVNYLGDGGGGANLLVIGVLSALLERNTSGLGQVLDVAVVDGVSALAVGTWGGLAEGWWNPKRGTNLWDGGAPFYDIYQSKDDLWIAVGALEEKFYSNLVIGLGLPEWRTRQHVRDSWPEMRESFSLVFKSQNRDYWIERLRGEHCCVAPVLEWHEVPSDPHMAARRVFDETDGKIQPRPAPRFSRTPGEVSRRAPEPDEDRAAILSQLGFGI